MPDAAPDTTVVSQTQMPHAGITASRGGGDGFAMARPSDHAPFPPSAGPARAMLPLQGLTVLAVEDSRFASDALRLMCQRSGARLRRADTLASARAHLRVYRPDVVIVDLGLPDGRGEDLIRDLAARMPQGSLVLGSSGAPDGRERALAAGAQGYLDKPVARVANFQTALLGLLPDRGGDPADEPSAPRLDPLALAEDLAMAAQLIADAREPWQHRYVAGFVGSLARQMDDPALEAAARATGDTAAGSARLASLIALRLSTVPQPFAPR